MASKALKTYALVAMAVTQLDTIITTTLLTTTPVMVMLIWTFIFLTRIDQSLRRGHFAPTPQASPHTKATAFLAGLVHDVLPKLSPVLRPGHMTDKSPPFVVLVALSRSLLLSFLMTYSRIYSLLLPSVQCTIFVPIHRNTIVCSLIAHIEWLRVDQRIRILNQSISEIDMLMNLMHHVLPVLPQRRGTSQTRSW